MGETTAGSPFSQVAGSIGHWYVLRHRHCRRRPVRELSGSPKTIAVTYNVRDLRVTPSGTVNLAAAEGLAAAPVEVSVQNSTAGTWTSSIIYQDATSGWLNLTPTSGPVGSEQTLRLSANALTTPGTYNASVRLSSGRSTTIIPVTYTVMPNLSVAPVSLTLTLAAVTDQTAPPSGASTTVSAARGTTAFTTSVSYGAGASGWLTVSGSSTPGTLYLFTTVRRSRIGCGRSLSS